MGAMIELAGIIFMYIVIIAIIIVGVSLILNLVMWFFDMWF